MDILLWIAIIVLILLPPSYDPAIIIKDRQVRAGTHPESKRPSCYGSYAFRHPHITAERDCGTCPHHFDCYEDSPYAKEA